MTMFYIGIKPLSGVNETQKLRAEIELRLQEELKKTGEELIGQVRADLSVPAGKTASAPFGLPRLRTGNLRDAMSFELRRENGQTVLAAGDLSGKAPYAEHLEYGTARMLPRPFLVPALLRWSSVLANRIKNIAGSAKP